MTNRGKSKMVKWRSVKEFPEEGLKVLVYTHEKFLLSGVVKKQDASPYLGKHWSILDPCDCDIELEYIAFFDGEEGSISHWCPIEEINLPK